MIGMGKYISNSFIQSLLLLALAAFMVTIYFMTTNISEQVASIETRLDAMETAIKENTSRVDETDEALILFAEGYEENFTTLIDLLVAAGVLDISP
jgi:predicted ATPase